VDIISAIAGIVTIATGLKKLFSSTRHKTPSIIHNHNEHTQLNVYQYYPQHPVIAAAPNTVEKHSVLLDDKAREILELPRDVEIVRPTLISPGLGIVSRPIFIESALSSLEMISEIALPCDYCNGRKWRVGALINGRWLCPDHLRGYLDLIAMGGSASFNRHFPGGRRWRDMERILGRVDGHGIIASEPKMRLLHDMTVTSSLTAHIIQIEIGHVLFDRFLGRVLPLEVRCELYGCGGTEIRICAFFYNSRDDQLKDTDNAWEWRTFGGHVYVGSQPILVEQEGKVITTVLKMPYRQLHLDENRLLLGSLQALRIRIAIYSYKEQRYFYKSLPTDHFGLI
jgi:hypothetical protein